MAAKVGAGKRRLLLQARAEGKSLADAAEAAGVSTRTAERLSVDPTFRAELQARLAELDAEDRNAFAQHRRQVLTASRFALAKQLELLSSNAAAVVRERAARAVQEHLARLFPAALDVSIATAELVQPTPERTLRDIFVVADDADHAQVIDVGRAAYGRLVADARARGEPTEGEAHAMRAREDEMATLQPCRRRSVLACGWSGTRRTWSRARRRASRPLTSWRSSIRCCRRTGRQRCSSFEPRIA